MANGPDLVGGSAEFLGRAELVVDKSAVAVELFMAGVALDSAADVSEEEMASLQGVHEHLSSIVGKGLGVLQQLHEMAPDRFPSISSGRGIDVSEPLALGPAPEDDVDPEPVKTQSYRPAADVVLAEGINRKTRGAQVRILTNIFGEDKQESIETLTQDQVVNLARAVGDIYRVIEVPARAKPLQEVRSYQLVDYISGMPKQELTNKYNIANVQVLLKKAVEIIRRLVSDDQLEAVFSQVLEAYEQAQEQK